MAYFSDNFSPSSLFQDSPPPLPHFVSLPNPPVDNLISFDSDSSSRPPSYSTSPVYPESVSDKQPEQKHHMQPDPFHRFSTPHPPPLDHSINYQIIKQSLTQVPHLQSTDPHSLTTWLFSVRKFLKPNLAPFPQLIGLLSSKTTGYLTNFWLENMRYFQDWTHFRTTIHNYFLPYEVRHKLSLQFVRRHQLPTEPAHDYLDSIITYSDVLNIAHSPHELISIVQFYALPSFRRLINVDIPPTSMVHLFNIAQAHTISAHSDASYYSTIPPPPSFPSSQLATHSSPVNLPSIQHTVSRPPSTSSHSLQCFRCKGIGHLSRNCPTPKQGNYSRPR